MIAKASCQHCGVHIEFEAENDGEFVACPSCGQQTKLIVPSSKPAAPKTEPKPPPPPPKPEPPKNFLPDKKPAASVRARVSTTALTVLLFLNLAVTIAGGVFLLLIWQRVVAVPVKARYDVKEFTYTSYTHKSEYSDKRYKTVLILNNYTRNFERTDERTEDAFDAAGVLDRLGGDGWQLVWSDGTRYIVQRPEGDWYHDSFSVELLEETNRASIP